MTQRSEGRWEVTAFNSSASTNQGSFNNFYSFSKTSVWGVNFTARLHQRGALLCVVKCVTQITNHTDVLDYCPV